jgi:predicted nucleic acid-binding protein
VKVYLDSGVFIDYLIGRGHTSHFLRATERRGRKPENLLADAEACFAAIGQRHEGMTSSLTCYEVEEAMYRELRRSTNNVANADRFIVPAARAVILQTLATIELFRIELLDLTSAVVIAQCDNVDLQRRGVRAADALHFTTALAHGTDVFITTDGSLAALDNAFPNSHGARMRCVDTDGALALLA